MEEIPTIKVIAGEICRLLQGRGLKKGYYETRGKEITLKDYTLYPADVLVTKIFPLINFTPCTPNEYVSLALTDPAGFSIETLGGITVKCIRDYRIQTDSYEHYLCIWVSDLLGSNKSIDNNDNERILDPDDTVSVPKGEVIKTLKILEGLKKTLQGAIRA